MNTENLRVKWIEVEASVWEAQQAELKALREDNAKAWGLARSTSQLSIDERKMRDRITDLESQLAKLRQCEADAHRLVRELDVIWNGEACAAQQASLCDMVAQIEKELRQGGEAVGWRPKINFQTDFTAGEPSKATVEYWREQGVDIEYAYLRPQPAIPPGYVPVPLIPTRAMEEVVNQDEWQWEDLLAAAEAITEDQYNEIASAPAIQPAIPPGYAPVPIEPTEEMIDAGLAFTDNKLLWHISRGAAQDFYKAMIASAPAIQPQAAATIAEQTDGAETAWSIAGRLALELECLLLDTKDTAIVSKWWDTAHEALEDYRLVRNAAPCDCGQFIFDRCQALKEKNPNIGCKADIQFRYKSPSSPKDCTK